MGCGVVGDCDYGVCGDCDYGVCGDCDAIELVMSLVMKMLLIIVPPNNDNRP